MSVAIEYAPVAVPVTVPSGVPGPCPQRDAGRRRGALAPRRAGAVSVLRAPSAPDTAAPLRLTGRGMLVVSALTALLAAALVWAAWLSASGDAASGAATPQGPAVVTVQSGDTLWSIAARVAPGRDPRAEVADLQQRNHLAGADLVPGQQLRVR